MNKLVELINRTPADNIEAQISKIPPEFEGKVKELAADFAYDRAVCKALNIDYSNIRQNDYRKLELLAYWVVR